MLFIAKYFQYTLRDEGGNDPICNLDKVYDIPIGSEVWNLSKFNNIIALALILDTSSSNSYDLLSGVVGGGW